MEFTCSYLKTLYWSPLECMCLVGTGWYERVCYPQASLPLIEPSRILIFVFPKEWGKALLMLQDLTSSRSLNSRYLVQHCTHRENIPSNCCQYQVRKYGLHGLWHNLLFGTCRFLNCCCWEKKKIPPLSIKAHLLFWNS